MAKKIKVTRFSAGNEPSQNAGKNALLIVADIVILISGFALGKATTSKSSDSPINSKKTTAIGEISSNPNGPSTIKGIVPAGFSHNTEGAVTAATSFVGLTPRLYFANDPAFRSSAIQMTIPIYTQSFIDGIASNRANSRDIYRNDPNAYFRETPLGYYVISEDIDAVQVGVWSQVMLVANPDFDGKTESKVHIIDLVWSNNDWKVSNWVTKPGPTPRWQAPASSVVTIEEFKKFIQPLTGGYDYVPSF